MPVLSQKIGFIGAGNMGQAMIGALVTAKTCFPENLYVCDIANTLTDSIRDTYHVMVSPDNDSLVHTCDVIIFAVKPQVIETVLSDLRQQGTFKNASGKKIFISIAAGTPIRKFESYIYDGADEEMKKRLPILRVMPNTPALVLSGMSGLCANQSATEKDVHIAKTILSAMGKVFECTEADMDAVTAVSGSGPAYGFYLAEAMIEAAGKLGIAAEDAAAMTAATLKGAMVLLENQGITAQELRKKVTSPGGTTEAAINVLEDRGVKQIIVEAVLAAAKRSKELSG